MKNSREKKKFVINKIKRFSLVIVLRRMSFFVIFAFILILTFVFGLWKIKNFNYSNSNLKYVQEIELDSYLEEFKGINIFLLNPLEVEKKILESNGYLKRVYIKKVLPDTLQISAVEYEPFFAGYSSDICLLFSEEGFKIDEMCDECEEECFDLVSNLSIIYITSDSVLENNRRLIFVEEFNNIRRILLEFGYESIAIYIDDGITTFEDSLGHTFFFDIANNLDIQISRLFLVAQKINSDMIEFKSLDLRFERPVMKLK